MTAIKLTT